jgi:hypothetical protein
METPLSSQHPCRHEFDMRMASPARDICGSKASDLMEAQPLAASILAP